MPAVPSALLPISSTILNRDGAAQSNATLDRGIQVVCAWPLSSNYGTGSRVLYYVLIAACVFARKAEWLRNACVGLALLLPALAALHGIVLAAVHVDGAIDMDIYGAFQMESIGVLTALVAVRYSSTYYNAPGRNTIFAWASLILAGLLSLTVEFYRSNSTHCVDDAGMPVVSSVRAFPYTITCGLTCDPNTWPQSPIRGGSANNVYVIPSPDKFTFNTATLICGASCIPAVLLLASMWFKILGENMKSGSKRLLNAPSIQTPDIATRPVSDSAPEEISNTPRESTRPSTDKSQEECEPEHVEVPAIDERADQKKAFKIATYFRKYCEIVISSAAVLAILIIGERNMLSPQVRHEQEPLGNIGQWSPLAGTVLGILGSLYLLLADAMINENDIADGRLPPPSHTDNSIIRRLARGLIKFNKTFLKHARDLDDREFREGSAITYPEIPGEVWRNVDLSRTVSNYSPSVHRVSTENTTAALELQHSHDTDFGDDAPRRVRRDTLEVPPSSPARPSSPHMISLSRCVSASEAFNRPESPGTPTIVISEGPLHSDTRKPGSRRHTVNR